jgi:hypothetical protein
MTAQTARRIHGQCGLSIILQARAQAGLAHNVVDKCDVLRVTIATAVGQAQAEGSSRHRLT